MSELLDAYIKHEGLLRSAILRICRRPDDADDLVQETFLRAFAAEAQADIKKPKAFLVTVATNLALSHVSKKAYTETDYLEDTGQTEILEDRRETAGDEILASRQKLLVFVRAVSMLPPRCKQVFLMRKLEGLKLKQIATRLNLSVSAVEKHVAVGLIKCSQFMREEGYELSDFGAVHLARMIASQSLTSRRGAQRVKHDEQ